MEEPLEPPEGLQSRLQQYVAAIRASPHNLLSPRGLTELESRHIPESLAFAQSLPSGPRVLDIGSGGGLPGIVVALARPDLDVHLMEATGKKAEFLAETAAQLEVDVTVHHGRAEELAGSGLAGTFDVVTARAVAPLERLVPWCAPYLKAGATIHAIKGERWADELVEAGQALAAAGLKALETPADHVEGVTLAGPRVVVLGRPTGQMDVP